MRSSRLSAVKPEALSADTGSMAAASASSLAGARLRTVVLVWKIAAVGGLVIFAAYTLFGAGFDHFFNRYWYNALILLAAGAASSAR